MTRLLLISILFASLARADEKSDAEAEMVKAQDNLDRGEFEAAIGRFNVARSLVPHSSGPYLGLGLAYARSGRCEQAIPYLEEYLRRKKSNPKAEAGDTLNDCRKRSVKPTGRIVVTSEPSGAEVRFDEVTGPILGVTPFESQPLPPGRHRVFVSKTGFRGASSDVVVNANERSTFTVALVTQAPASPQSPPETRQPERAPRIVVNLPQPPPAPAKVVEPGKLVVDVTPEAKLSLNGSELAAATTHYEGTQPPGELNLIAEKDGYRAVATSVKLESGKSERRELKLQPVRKNVWLGVGIGFTVVAAAMGAGALGSYVVANDKPRDTSDYTSNKNATLAMQGLFYPTLAVAAVGYIVWGVLNRGKVADGPPLRVKLDLGALRVRF
jgi:hypothetical protein